MSRRIRVEIKIGIEETMRELVVASNQSQEEVEKLVTAALEGPDGPSGLLRLTDEKGRTYVVPAKKISYVEIAPSDTRRVGFSTGD